MGETSSTMVPKSKGANTVSLPCAYEAVFDTTTANRCSHADFIAKGAKRQRMSLIGMHKYCVWAQIEVSGCEYGPNVPGGFFIWALCALHCATSQGCGEVVGDLRVQGAAAAALVASP